ncbi:MAG: M23 family metallopeptidase [Pseudomonadota bacterium]
MRLALALLFPFATASALAEGFSIRPPLDCGPEANTPCIIQQYVDSDRGPGASDFTCGPLSYDGHKGTDFRLATRADMARGATVVASAAGRVVAIRDGMADINVTDANAPDVSGRECGNGLVIAHADGWETQYCHLKQGSLRVTKGTAVQAGQPLGQIGLSGRTAFPHVHLSVRKDGKVVDPFNPEGSQGCMAPAEDLWDATITPVYRAGGFLDAGFHDGIPEFQQIKQGDFDPQSLTSDAPAIVIWAYLFGGQSGDILQFSIVGPDGWSFKSDIELEKTQAQLFRATGKRKPETGWPAGTYQGQISWLRDGEVYATQAVSLSVTD